MAAVNWTGMTPEDVFESLAKAPKVARWEGLDVAFDPFGHQVALVLGRVAFGRDVAGAHAGGFYATHEAAEARLRADGYVIVNPATPEMIAEFERQLSASRRQT